MSALYAPPPEVIRLTTENPFRDRLDDPMGSGETRSPLCGSRIAVDVNLDQTGRVNAVGMRVNACAFGQAAATILAAGIMGKTASELAKVRDDLAGWVAGTADAPSWPNIEHLRPERLNTVRKASVQLAFQAAAEAAENARSKAAA